MTEAMLGRRRRTGTTCEVVLRTDPATTEVVDRIKLLMGAMVKVLEGVTLERVVDSNFDEGCIILLVTGWPMYVPRGKVEVVVRDAD